METSLQVGEGLTPAPLPLSRGALSQGQHTKLWLIKVLRYNHVRLVCKDTRAEPALLVGDEEFGGDRPRPLPC